MRAFIITLFCVSTFSSTAQECYDLSSRSDWIGVVCYTGDMLHIQMQGEVYQFCGVERIVFDGLIQAASPGAFYDSMIRGRFSCQQQRSNDIYWIGLRGERMYVP